MKVALVNKNPAVSRLITLSLNKIGANYVQVSQLDELVDDVNFLIIDSDVDVGDADLKQMADKIMYLIPRGEEIPEFADAILEKPFLPTDFIKVFEHNKPNITKEVAPEVVSDTQFHTEISDEISFELPEFDESSLDALDDSFDIVDEATKDEIEFTNLRPFDDKPEELEEADTELLSVDDEMQELSVSDEPIDLFQIDHEEQNLELDTLDSDELKDDENSDDMIDFGELKTAIDEIDSMQDDDVKLDEPDEPLADLNFNEVTDELQTEADSIENIKHILDDIDMSDLSATEDKTALPDELNDENLGIDISDIAELSREVDSFDEIGFDEDMKLDLPQSQEDDLQGDLESSEAQLDAFDDVLQDINDEVSLASELIDDEEFKDMSEEKECLMSAEKATDIGDIDEASMMQAFGLEASDDICTKEKGSDEPSCENLKDELSKKITEHLTATLNDSFIKDALKDMNIKINISFEEK